MNVRELEEKDIGVISVGCNCCFRSQAEDYDDQDGGYGFGVKNKEWERILEFCKAMNVAVGNKLFKEGKSTSILWACPIKISGRLLFGKEKPKEDFERYVSLT